MAINNVIQRLKTGTYTVTRTAASTLSQGRKVAGSTSTFPTDAIVQPLDPRTMLPLPEGVRAEDVRLIHTADLIRTQDQNGEADAFTIGGEQFYAWKVSGPWTLRGETHYEVHAARRGKP